jgi:hypothetical protein
MLDVGFQKIEEQFGPIFHQNVLTTDHDLLLKDYRSDDLVGHWVADGLRQFAHADIAFENPSYVSRDIYQGTTTMADMFDIFPHIYNPSTGKAWTVKTFNLSGSYIQLLLAGVFRSGIYLRMSNAKAVLDLYQSVDQLQYLELDGKPVDPNRMYTVAGTDGIVDAISLINTFGIDIGVAEIKDSGVEAWRVIANYFKTLSPITKDKLVWENRVRTLQPDVTVRPEEIDTTSLDSHTLNISVTIRNTGMQKAIGSELTIVRAPNPGDTLADRNIDVVSKSQPISVNDLNPGEAQKINVPWDITGLAPGRYAITYSLSPAAGELETENNVLDSYIDVPDTNATPAI